MPPIDPLLRDRRWDSKEPAAGSVVDSKAIQEQMQRILSDPLFHNSKRSSDMLKYIVDRTLDGQHECLKERIIGIVTPESPDPLELAGKNCTLVSYSRDPAEPTSNAITLDLIALEKAGNIKKSPTQDVAVIKISMTAKPNGLPGGGSPTQTLPGVTVTRRANNGVLGVALENLKPFNQVLTGNPVVVFGYPGSIGLKNVPQIDYDRPLLRRGIVAGTNPAQQSIILDCSTYPGNSGGPVLEIDTMGNQVSFKIIGVVIQYIPFPEVRAATNAGLGEAVAPRRSCPDQPRR